MKAAVVYESMFGSTRRIAEAIAAGLEPAGPVRVIRAAEAGPGVLADVDLVVVGAPTHAWSMPRPKTRQGAPAYVRRPDSGLVLEAGADQAPGVEEWLDSLPQTRVRAAAFDTRVDMSPLLTGRASRAIERRLRRHGAVLVVPARSFLVDKKSHLLAGQEDRARAWGSELAAKVALAGIG